MNRIGIIGAMDEEVDILVELMDIKETIEKASLKEIELRLNRFDYEESKIGIYDYVIKNDDLEKTVQIIMTIIENEYKLANGK